MRSLTEQIQPTWERHPALGARDGLMKSMKKVVEKSNFSDRMNLLEGGLESPISNVDLGKVRIQELVVASAEGLGIDPKKLIFKWDVVNGISLPERRIRLDKKVYILKIYVGEKSQALTFEESLVHKSIENPKEFMSECRTSIVAALRKLKRPAKSKYT